MGGAADNARASSPLKRPAADLEDDLSSSQRDDVDMITVPASGPSELEEIARSVRARSVDMLRDEVQDTSNTKSTRSNAARNPQTDIPSIDEQIKTITTLCTAFAEKLPTEGEKAYLVSKRWLERVTSRGSEARKKSKEEPEGEIGAVDNSDIIQRVFQDSDKKDHVELKPGAGSNDFVLFDEDAWRLIVEWYGKLTGTPPIIRYAHNTNPDRNGIPQIQFEYHPLIYKVHRLYATSNTIKLKQNLVDDAKAPVFVCSRSQRYHDFAKAIKKATGIPDTTKMRVWRIPKVQPTSDQDIVTPPTSRPGSSAGLGVLIGPVQPQSTDPWDKMYVDVPTLTALDRGTERFLVEHMDTSANPHYNGSSDLAFVGLGDNQTLVLDEHLHGTSYVSNFVPKSNSGTSSAFLSAFIKTGAASAPTSGRSSPAPSGPVTRGRSRASRSGRVGIVGLINLGNTCYMNSALQCVGSVKELTKYFLSGAAMEELNSDNPLGNDGNIAIAYNKLLAEMYRDPPPTSFAPKHFKAQVGRYAPSFSGYGQQDSQEFVGFLLDGLQEDLSRIKKKPYIEKPDSTDEMVNNPEAIKDMADKVWDITKRRDDSVIADLFTGMYKSTLVCPVCDKVSITFDPFNNLTLQLPIENSWGHQVIYFPLNHKPIKIDVDIGKHDPIKAMKAFVGARMGVPVERLFVAEMWKGKFYKLYPENETASDILPNDAVHMYELESSVTNWPPPKSPKKKTTADDTDEPDEVSLDDRMLVPVYYRRHAKNSSVNKYSIKRSNREMVEVPHVIVLTSEEARSHEAIRRKVIEKMLTLTTKTDMLDDVDDGASGSVADSLDPDLVITTGSDADSSGGNKVIASSVDGDDEFVDVTMRDTSAPSTVEKPQFPVRRPKIVDPDVFLPGELQNMFDLCYVPSPLNTLLSKDADEDTDYPLISSREPTLEEEDNMETSEGSGRAGSETSEEARKFNSSTGNTRMTEESESDASDEDSAPPPVIKKSLPLRPSARKKPLRTYSKKQMRKIQKQQKSSPVEDDDSTHGPLIRLGEILVVNWAAEAWDAFFGGDSTDVMRGLPTWDRAPEFNDPTLNSKRLARAARKKSGITLADCLDEFGKEEILSEFDTWYCPRCKEHQRASKKLELWKTPDILVMHLKRFSSSAMRRDKLDVLVDFPLEGLDLTTKVIDKEDGKQEVYDLIAIDDHWGGLGGGHYTAFAKNWHDGKWYDFNDASVRPVQDLTRMVTQAAYLLFYRRRSDGYLGGQRIQEKLLEYDNTASEDEEDSGEDQRLGVNSSQVGSSSASTGVGQTRHPRNGSQSQGGSTMMTVNPSALEHDQLPSYQVNEDEDQPLLHNDPMQSVEDDEGLGGMGDGMNYNNVSSNFNQGGGVLNFGSLNGLDSNWSYGLSPNRAARSDASGSSNAVQHNSSASDSELDSRIHDFDGAMAVDDNGYPFHQEDELTIPDMDDAGQAAQTAIQAEMLEQQRAQSQHFVSPDHEILEVEEPAAEIHIGEGDELKLD